MNSIVLEVHIYHLMILLLILVGEHAEMAHRGGHGSAPALGVPSRCVPCMFSSYQSNLPALTIDSLQPSIPLGLLQAGLVSSEITLLTGSDPGSQIVAIGTIVSSRSPCSSQSKGELYH